MSALSIVGVSQAQTISNDDYNSLTLGNLASDTSGASAGQGGYYIYGGATSDYQVASIDATHGNSLKIISGSNYSSTANTYNRFVFKSISTTATAGNDVIKGSFEIYTGPATGAGKIQCVLYDSTMGVVGISYDFATKKIGGLGRLTPTATGTAAFYNIGLGTATYAANTWVSVSFTYNKTTGAYSWTYPEGTYSFNNSAYTFTTNMVPVEFDFVSVTATGNTVANQAAIDNFNLLYSNTAALSTDETIMVSDIITIYPNPVIDYLNIKSSSKLENVSVYDFNGRKINVKLEGNKVDASSLPSGNYLINIETKKGKTTEKFIKK